MVVFNLLAILVWYISGADSDHLLRYFSYHLYLSLQNHFILGTLY